MESNALSSGIDNTVVNLLNSYFPKLSLHNSVQFQYAISKCVIADKLLNDILGTAC